MVIILMHFKDTLRTAVSIAELIPKLTPVVKKSLQTAHGNASIRL